MNTGNDMLDYPQLITRDLILQLPFVQISEFAKKRRAPNWKEIEKEIKLIVERNNVELIDLLANSMLKAITEEVTLGNVTEDTLEELKDKMGYLNSKFRRLDAYFDTLTTYEQRDLLLPFIEKEINTLVRNKDSFKTILISKEQWKKLNLNIYFFKPACSGSLFTCCNKLLRFGHSTTFTSLIHVFFNIFAFRKEQAPMPRPERAENGAGALLAYARLARSDLVYFVCLFGSQACLVCRLPAPLSLAQARRA